MLTLPGQPPPYGQPQRPVGRANQGRARGPFRVHAGNGTDTDAARQLDVFWSTFAVLRFANTLVVVASDHH
jgi:hypothetical protein